METLKIFGFLFLTILIMLITNPPLGLSETSTVPEPSPMRVVTEQVYVNGMTYAVFILTNTGQSPSIGGVANLTLDKKRLELLKQETK